MVHVVYNKNNLCCVLNAKIRVACGKQVINAYGIFAYTASYEYGKGVTLSDYVCKMVCNEHLNYWNLDYELQWNICNYCHVFK
jgi:hypothetical protein